MLRATMLVLVLALALGASPRGFNSSRIAAQEATPASCPPGTEEENLAVVQRYYDLVNAHQFEDLLDVYAPVVIQHAADVPDARGAEEAVANLSLFLDAFPDLRSEVDQMYVDDDLVAVRVIQSGTQENDFLGVPGSGKHAAWTLIGIFRIECGRIAEHWVEVDQISRLQQLGAIPQLGASSPATPTGSSSAPVASPVADCPITTEDENADLIRRWYEDVWNQGDVSGLEAFIAPGHTHHRVLNRQASGAEARKQTVQQWRAAFPDLSTTLDFLLTDDDIVVARWLATGTQDGPWENLAPTGRTVTWTGNTIFRIECGRIAEEWSEAASLSFFHQLGVIESPAAPPPPTMVPDSN